MSKRSSILFFTPIICVASAHLFAADTQSLVGTWKLVSLQVVVQDEEPRDVFGKHPRGFLVLTPEGRAMVLTTAQDPHPRMGDAERAYMGGLRMPSQ